MEKLCIFCKHFRMSPNGSDWSNEALNIAASLSCDEGIWWILMDEGTDQFRQQIQRAKTCKHYDLIDN